MTAGQALVMLTRDGDHLVVIDSGGTRHRAQTPTELWELAGTILTDSGAPPLTEGDAAPEGEPSSDADVGAAVRVLGDRLKRVAEDEYGAPVVGAATVVAKAGAERLGGVLRKASKGGRRGWRGRR